MSWLFVWSVEGYAPGGSFAVNGVTNKIELSKAKVHVVSDSVLCRGRMHGHPEASIQKQIKDKKINFNISRCPMNTENYLESTENQLSSSGIFSRDTQLCRFSQRFR